MHLRSYLRQVLPHRLPLLHQKNNQATCQKLLSNQAESQVTQGKDRSSYLTHKVIQTTFPHWFQLKKTKLTNPLRNYPAKASHLISAVD